MSEAILIGQIITGVLTVFIEQYKAAGVKEEEIDAAVLKALAKAKATKPQDLPDV